MFCCVVFVVISRTGWRPPDSVPASALRSSAKSKFRLRARFSRSVTRIGSSAILAHPARAATPARATLRCATSSDRPRLHPRSKSPGRVNPEQNQAVWGILRPEVWDYPQVGRAGTGLPETRPGTEHRPVASKGAAGLLVSGPESAHFSRAIRFRVGYHSPCPAPAFPVPRENQNAQQSL